MNKIFTTFVILLLISHTSIADKRNALFLGNSYTYFNGGMQNMIANIATSLGDTLTHDNNTPGGYTANQHSTNATTISKIIQGGWDYVAIQCQSQEPSFSTAQVLAQTYPYVMTLDSLIQANNTCAETVMFMTWGRMNGDLQNYPNDTYDAMQQRLRNGYTLFADSAHATISPVGAAWKVMRDNHAGINLYNADGSHPSVNGTYLAACVFYCTMFKKSCVGSQYLPSGVGNGDALSMQQVASSVVLDSLENWQQYGGIPDASFTIIPQLGFYNQIVCTNSSLRYSNSSWNFGDGSPVNNSTSPNHTFPIGTGTYTICLTVTSLCGKTDSICQTIMISPSNNSNYSTTHKIRITQYGDEIKIDNDFGNSELSFLDINGRRIYHGSLKIGSQSINLNRYAKGIYILQVKKRNELLKLHKVHNY